MLPRLVADTQPHMQAGPRIIGGCRSLDGVPAGASFAQRRGDILVHRLIGMLPLRRMQIIPSGLRMRRLAVAAAVERLALGMHPHGDILVLKIGVGQQVVADIYRHFTRPVFLAVHHRQRLQPVLAAHGCPVKAERLGAVADRFPVHQKRNPLGRLREIIGARLQRQDISGVVYAVVIRLLECKHPPVEVDAAGKIVDRRVGFIEIMRRRAVDRYPV